MQPVSVKNISQAGLEIAEYISAGLMNDSENGSSNPSFKIGYVGWRSEVNSLLEKPPQKEVSGGEVGGPRGPRKASAAAYDPVSVGLLEKGKGAASGVRRRPILLEVDVGKLPPDPGPPKN